MLVQDVMTTDVITVDPDRTVQEIARLLLERAISAAFVVDHEGAPLGVVSEGDLIRRRETETERRHSWWLRLFADPAKLAEEYAKSRGRRARDVMTPSVIRIAETDTLGEAATLLETHRIKRLAVTRGGRLVGVISRADLVRALASAKPDAPGSEAVDRAIREKLIAELRSQPWSSADAKNVVVSDAVVHLWGVVASEEERVATRVAAEGVPGVRAVEDHLTVRPIMVVDA